jgi:hypothetical protein
MEVMIDCNAEGQLYNSNKLGCPVSLNPFKIIERENEK